ncbi:MAG TPA: hypothetical protein VGS06_27795 [Streptosporangiaceae bacterium]|nr:hypothetical protein [Streptosporangiaceae bacterium]
MRTWPAAAVAAVVLLAGCGPAAAPATVAVSSAHPATGSVGGLRERAQALIWRLVGELSPPPGTRTVHLAKLPPPLNNPPSPLPAGWVRVQRTLEAPAQPGSAWAGLLARTPLIGTITPGATGSVVLPAPEPGIDVAEFGVTLVQLSSTTILIAVGAEAAWLPARTPAEHLNPASFGSVTISAQRWAQTRVVTRTFTAQADISRLTAIMNAGTPAPTRVVAGMHCAAVATVYILRFTPRAAGDPSVVATLGACPHAYDITVNGKQQPSLWDDGKLRMAAAALAGVH